MLDRMYKRRCNPQNKNFKTHIILSFPGGPRGQKCKIPIVRSPKPAVFAVEPAPQDHQLTIPRNPKGKMHKGIARQHVQKNVQSTKKEHQNTYNTRIPRESQGPKM